MIRLLISLVTASAVISCQVEDTEPTSGILNVDPNNDTVVPEGVTFADVDLNSDGVIDITDLMIVSKFFGQSAEEETEDPIVSCPAGFHGGELVPKVVGYYPELLPENSSIPTDDSGRRLPDRHKESCAYLFPYTDLSIVDSNERYGRQQDTTGLYHIESERGLDDIETGNRGREPPNPDCLLNCQGGHLCSQKAKEVSCRACPRLSYQELKIEGYMPIKFPRGYAQSDDPTKCKLGELVDEQYKFPHPSGEGFFTYALLHMPMQTYLTLIGVFMTDDPAFDRGEIAKEKMIVAIRVWVTPKEKIKELKVKIQDMWFPKSDAKEGDKIKYGYPHRELVGTYTVNDIDYKWGVTQYTTKKASLTIISDENISNIHETNTTYYTDNHGKGIQIGEEQSEKNSYRSNAGILGLDFIMIGNDTHNDRNFLFKFKHAREGWIDRSYRPTRVRAKYFPEDIEATGN